MNNNTAFAYLLEDKYASIYVNLNGFEQIIFYWDLKDQVEKQKPKWRESKLPIETDMTITSYNTFGFTLIIDNRIAEFSWYEYDNKNNMPAHKAKLVNFADWEFDPEFKFNSPTALGSHYTGTSTGYYGEPQTYGEEE